MRREAIEADQAPRSLIVLGGGAIGVDLAHVFARFGAAVTVIEALDRLLAQDEPADVGGATENRKTRTGERIL
jgi:pyruvate/2-oxoglutarate dehydrogenase complex dihydrolipoamide dehydrogenase (E3) component